MKNSKILLTFCLLSVSLEYGLQASTPSENARSSSFVRSYLRNAPTESSSSNLQNDLLPDENFELPSFSDEMLAKDPSLYDLGSSKMSLGFDEIEPQNIAPSSEDFEKMIDNTLKFLREQESRIALGTKMVNDLESDILKKQEQLSDLIKRVEQLKDDMKNKRVSPARSLQILDELFNLYDSIMEN